MYMKAPEADYIDSAIVTVLQIHINCVSKKATHEVCATNQSNCAIAVDILKISRIPRTQRY